MRRAIVIGSIVAALAALAGPSSAGDPVPIDRAVIRWYAPETGGATSPQFVFARELAFEARLEALADRDAEPGAYQERHVRAALDRHVAETLLASIPVVPTPDPAEVARRAEAARGVLEQRVKGRPRLVAAAASEGISSDELDALLRRQAKASLYVDRMIAPMLDPSDLELRELWKAGQTPFSTQPFDMAAPLVRRWYLGQRLGQALEAYYQGARSRVTITLIR